MLKILGRPNSINVRKVLWTCVELNLPFTLEGWGAGVRDPNTPEFLALNPHGMVPVLIDGDYVLWESNTICRYLAHAYGGEALLPGTARARADVEKWMDWQATELNNAWRYAFMARVRNSPAHQDPEALAASVASWNRHMGLLDQHLASTGAYATGAQFSLADVVLGLSTQRWYMTPIDRPELPAIRRYYDLLSERPGFIAHGRNGMP